MPKHNISKRRSTSKIHAARMRAIRPYVSFNYDMRKPLTSYQKRKIKKYYDEVQGLTARSFQTYRPRNKARLAKAMQYSGQNKKLSEFKAALIPTPGQSKVKVKFNKAGRLRVESQYSSSTVVPLYIDQLLTRPDAHIAEQLASVDGNAFTIMADIHEIPQVVDRELVAREVGKLMMKYSDDEKNNWFGNWLHGLRSHTFKNQSAIHEYLRDKEAARNERARERRASNARKRRASTAAQRQWLVMGQRPNSTTEQLIGTFSSRQAAQDAVKKARQNGFIKLRIIKVIK